MILARLILAPFYLALLLVMGVALIIVGALAFIANGAPYEIKVNYPRMK